MELLAASLEVLRPRLDQRIVDHRHAQSSHRTTEKDMTHSDAFQWEPQSHNRSASRHDLGRNKLIPAALEVLKDPLVPDTPPERHKGPRLRWTEGPDKVDLSGIGSAHLDSSYPD